MPDTVAATVLMQAIPFLLVSLFGIAWAASSWRLHPAVSACVIAALVARSVVSLGSIAFTRHTFVQLERGAEPATLGYQSGLFNALSSVLGAASLLLLIVAVFIGRAKPDERSMNGRTHG